MSASELYTKGARIWIPDKDVVWRAAELLEDYKGQKVVSVQYEDGEESTLGIKDKNSLPLLRNPDILIGENDLTSLSYLNEPEVLYNLHVRFCDRNIIYTYCGIVLVAINPYEQLPIYGSDLIQAYSGQDLASMDPHIFAVAEEAFKRMSRFEQNQSIIVSGESGAGKTVSAKYAMRYFATVGGSQAETQIEKKVLASNPIMEAIGNAKTTRNDNSSRFGKYIEIGFNRQLHIIGANMRTYLLEKSRVVFQASDERNYHIFYQVCASANIPEFKDFHLDHQDSFFYTNQGESPTIRDIDDAKELGNTKEALSLLGIVPKDQQQVFQIVAAILHFGNVCIREKDNETCEIPKQDKHIGLFCRLLGIEESQMRMWLCNRQIMTVNETLTKPLTALQAKMARDALAKHIYANLFGWIVTQINKTLHTTAKQHKFIGVLDIYGFETFEINSFEQFCINYANEKLQQQFNMHVFKLEQEEYVKEQIEWSFIDFYDNQPCIDLIENRLGLFDLLDEECKMPKGSDQNWCQKLYEKHLNKSAHFDKPRMSNIAFIIHHFADKVIYQADGFLEKNRDTILPEQINILKASEFELVAELFTDKPEGKKRAGSVNYTIKAAREQPKAGNKEHKKSVGSQFRDSLQRLMQTLNATTPHYIRCIKPNDEKEPFIFEPKRAVEQLRACGVLETIRISAAGYPSRWTYNEFYQRYRVLAKFKDLKKTNMKKTCENILEKLITDTDKYRFGKTKIFFRAGQVAYMEKLRSDKLQACGVMIQKHIRGWLQLRKYKKIRRTALLVQSYGRGVLARRHALFLKRTKAATKIQKSWRGHRQRTKFSKVRSAAVRIQAAIRGFFGRRYYRTLLQNAKAVILQSQVRTFLARRRFKKVLHGFILLQSHARRIRAKKELKQLKIEAKSVEHIKKVNVGLENKIIELQQKLDVKAKDVILAREKESQVTHLKSELEKFKEVKETAKGSSNRITELEREIELLRAELTKEKEEKTDLMKKKVEMKKEHDQVLDSLLQEKDFLKEHLDAANEKIKAQDQSVTDTIKQKVEAANQLVVKEFESERGHHQRLVKEYGRLQQRLENLQSEMQVVTGGHKRTLSDLSMISVESAGSSAETVEKSQEDRESSQDQGYGTVPRKVGEGVEINRQENILDKVINEVAGDSKGKDIDIGLVLKLQNRIKELEKEKNQYRMEVDRYEDQSPKHSFSNLSESAFDALKMQELENDNDKLKRTVGKLNKAIAASTNFEKTESVSPAGKEFLDQFEAMTDELERRREECLNLRAILAEQSIGTHAIAKEYYGGDSDLLNEDQELAVAYKSQKDLNSLLEKQLQKTERDSTFKEKELKREIEELKKDNNRQQKLIGQNLSLTPEAKIEATMQHEITRLTSENLDLRETIDKQTDQLRKLKKMLKVYAKRLKEGEAAEIVAEIEQDEQVSASSGLLAEVRHREREYIGMLEYRREDEPALIKNLVMNLKPPVALGALPGLPAYIIFMCVRHTDYINDDEKVRSLLSSTISGIKRVIKKYHDDIEYLMLWIANTCRLLHTLKQYSGEKAFQSENSGRQNEHCLRNFDLSEYRLVFSDHAVWIYQSLIKILEETIQPMIVPAVLEHEAIAGLTGSKPTGLRGRSSSTNREIGSPHEVHSLDSLMKSLNKFLKLSIQHAIDPELTKQIFRQLYYFICAGALNNLLLRKDMCNWSKGMQIRYNLSHLEQWLRENKLQESGAHLSLDPIIQASQLLQARKTIADVDSIAEMCSKLTLSQIVKILNLYTPVDEFEERVPISFIRKIQEKLKHRQDDSNVLLMDTKFAFPVTFPFNPSSVTLESLQVPEHFHLGFLKRS